MKNNNDSNSQVYTPEPGINWFYVAMGTIGCYICSIALPIIEQWVVQTILDLYHSWTGLYGFVRYFIILPLGCAAAYRLFHRMDEQSAVEAQKRAEFEAKAKKDAALVEHYRSQIYCCKEMIGQLRDELENYKAKAPVSKSESQPVSPEMVLDQALRDLPEVGHDE